MSVIRSLNGRGLFHAISFLAKKTAAIFAEGKGAVHAIKWAVQRSRYMTLETIATMSDDPLISLPAAS